MKIPKIITASSTLIGVAIGAGILGIPYVIMKSGLAIGLFHLILLSLMLGITMLYLGEIALRTKSSHHLTGYAKKYLGKKGKTLMFMAFAFGIYAALLAYLIGEGESLSQIFFNSSNYAMHFAIAFWIILSIITFKGLKALKRGEEIGVASIIAIMLGIIIFAVDKININNLTYISTQNFFAPFGVILFALLSFSALPEVKEELKGNEKLLKRSIIISITIIAVIYALFAIVILGWKGQATPQIATLALGKIFILFGILTMFTSYLALAIALIDTLRLDYNLSKTKSWLIVSITPLIIYLLLTLTNLLNFTKVLGVGGVISGGLTAILILLMIPKAKLNGDRKPEYNMPYSKLLTMILILIFILGALVETLSVIN